MSMNSLRSPRSNVQSLINSAMGLNEQLESRLGTERTTLDWQILADIAYWRFCRFASFVTGRLVELDADPNALAEFKAVLERFIELTSHLLELAKPDEHKTDREAVEKILRANLHCKERAEWLECKIREAVAFDSQVQQLSRKLTSARTSA